MLKNHALLDYHMLKTCGFGKKLPQLATLIDQNWSGVWSKWCNIVKYILIYQSNNNLKSITQPRHLQDLLTECHIEMYNRFSRLKKLLSPLKLERTIWYFQE